MRKNQEKSILIFKHLVFVSFYGEASPIREWQSYNSTNSLSDAEGGMNSLLGNHVKVEAANKIHIWILKHIINVKLMSMKSHDHHILLQQILPLCIQHRLNKTP